MKNIFYNYLFSFPDGQQKEFYVDFDEQSLESKLQSEAHYPDWTQLEFHQCMNCPLTTEDFLYCPLAVNLVPIIYWSKDLNSYDEVEIHITSKEREVRANTSLQRGISSLLGLLMSSSACPKMKFLRPLARFHLPLATQEETIFRAVSMAFLADYFVSREKDDAGKFDKEQSDHDSLRNLKFKYAELQDLNRFMADRIRDAIKKDAAINAIVLLDVLSKEVSYSIDDSLQQISYLFNDKDKADVA